ncbi:MAG: HU family DNA-binding protein [Proteobacteria bacterium]|nr:HU family DNA-binding protein [Pseudomonadota bacterium]MBQ4359965.1 HU family DNA-binding protein [Pseudomonadota bacterium]
MTKAELLNAVLEKVQGLGLQKKQTGPVVDAVFDVLTLAICKDGNITYPGFGTFKVKEVAARAGRNPRTNEPIQIKASKKVNFKAAPKLKVAINGEEEKAEEPAEVKKEAKKAAKKEAAPAKKAPAKKAKK